jgi:hypothetical protein
MCLHYGQTLINGINYGEILSGETGYSRIVDGVLLEFTNEPEISSVYKTVY